MKLEDLQTMLITLMSEQKGLLTARNLIQKEIEELDKKIEYAQNMRSKGIEDENNLKT